MKMKTDLPKILVLCPIRNEDHSIPLFLKGMEEMDYPKELLDIYWLENDSTDRTLKMLRKAEQGFSDQFGSLRLASDSFIEGGAPKNPPGGYWKDIKYGGRRIKPWMMIWRKHFIPQIVSTDAPYCLIWMADCIPPPKGIREYLKVFREVPDAGWVGGAYHRRYPRQKKLESPIGCAANVKKPTRCKICGHFWVMKTAPFRSDPGFTGKSHGVDIMMCLTDNLRRQNLYVYYQPTVYIKHISTDGKIYKAHL